MKKKLRLIQSLKMFIGGSAIAAIVSKHENVGIAIMLILGALDAVIFYLTPSKDEKL